MPDFAKRLLCEIESLVAPDLLRWYNEESPLANEGLCFFCKQRDGIPYRQSTLSYSDYHLRAAIGRTINRSVLVNRFPIVLDQPRNIYTVPRLSWLPP